MAECQAYYPSNSTYGINLLFSGREDCSPGYLFGPAKRTNYLLHYVVAGQGSYFVDNKTYHLHEGQAFLIFPGDLTTYKADDTHPWSYLWIGFDGNDCDNLLEHLGLTKQCHVVTSTAHKVTSELLETIVRSSPIDLANPVKRLSAITEIFSSLVSDAVPKSLHQTDPIEKALAFIHSNYQYDVRINNLADTVNMERTWLYRLFIDEMGQSPKAYLTAYRLKMAKDYLLTSQLTLTEVALTCGFSSSSAFHKHFKKASGITPKAFRENT